MKEQLRELQAQQGAIFLDDAPIPYSFGNDDQALATIETGAILCDRSHWGLLQLTGIDRLRFLHNQTTNHINRLQPNQGCDTIFVNSTGRTLDLATVYATDDALLCLVSPNRRQSLLQWMDRYIFPMDKVNLSDVSENFGILTLIGTQSGEYLQKIGISADILTGVEGTHHLANLEIGTIRVAIGTGLNLVGYTLITPFPVPLWQALVTVGAIPAGEKVWQYLRVRQGRPAPDRELTEDYNPLEAGLWQAISFEKGCYIGQETIARLNTYQGVKQRLWGVKLAQPVAPNTPILLEDTKVGVITSVEGNLGLGYLKTKAGGAGLTVKVGETSGELRDAPFLRHEYYQPNAGS